MPRAGAPILALVAAADIHEDGLVFGPLAPAQQLPVPAPGPRAFYADGSGEYRRLTKAVAADRFSTSAGASSVGRSGS